MNIEKEKQAIQTLQAFVPQNGDPYYLCYSGGKDSDCIRILAQLANVPHEIWNNHTTVDAPETVRYIRTIPNIHINYPKETMWKLIERKGMPPTRLVRYCCSELKERGGQGRKKVTGVRWAESKNRARNQGAVTVIGKQKTMLKEAEEHGLDYIQNDKGGIVMNDDNADTRRFVEHCYRTTSTLINPIIDWTDEDVWQFLHHYGCESNPLYKCGFKRIGCIGCPMATKGERIKEFNLYPKYKENYIKAFDRMIARRTESGKTTQWANGEEVFKWWIGDDPNQLSMFDDETLYSAITDMGFSEDIIDDIIKK